jgi:hypothetical protein
MIQHVEVCRYENHCNIYRPDALGPRTAVQLTIPELREDGNKGQKETTTVKLVETGSSVTALRPTIFGSHYVPLDWEFDDLDCQTDKEI